MLLLHLPIRVLFNNPIEGHIMYTLSANLTEEQQSFLTPQEVSDLLRVSIHTVRRWIKEGKLPAYKVGRAWRISKVDLDNWLNRQRTPATVDN
jgi:excisionase family DNA binding protein